jgi:cytochrome c oxidase cbb3-type subunit 3
MSDNKETKNVILNEEERTLLLDHNYDGIEEFDYPLPTWWTATFVGTVIFAIAYFFFYEIADGPSLAEEFKRDWAKVSAVRAEMRKKSGDFSLDSYNSWVASNDGVNKGKEIFDENCMSCHEDGGKGDIGPNLTDKHWLNVKEVSPEAIYSFVRTGNEDNGMPAWADTLSKEELYSVVSYVLSLRNTFVPGGKEAQGEIIE